MTSDYYTDVILLLYIFQIDYFERAKRLEEIPLIKKAYEEQRIKDMELWELQEEERVIIAYCLLHSNVIYFALWSMFKFFAEVSNPPHTRTYFDFYCSLKYFLKPYFVIVWF